MRRDATAGTLLIAMLFGFGLGPAQAATAASFADLAALSLAAPVVVHATAIKDQRLSPRDAPGLAAGMARFLVTATTTAAIVAPADVPPRLTYLIDLAVDARGKAPKPVAREVLLFLRPGTAAGQYALIDGHAELPWTAAVEATVRSVLTDNRRGTVPIVTGIASAFRVPGGVPGEAESQFFVSTRDGKPVSLVVLTRPGEQRRLTIALGDVIDDAAAGVPPATLLWYRLACGLPPALPPSAGAAADVADDYRFVLHSLGPCGRTF